MINVDGGESPSRLEGKLSAMIVCWILGFGSLISWNSMLTIGDYYYNLFPDYHPSRVLTLVYQPFAFGTISTVKLLLYFTHSIIHLILQEHFFGVADACVQGGIVGDLSFMLPDFIQSFFAGMAASGALTSALRVITIAAFEKSNNGLRKGAIKYFRSKAALEGSKTVQADLAAAGIQIKEDHHEQNERLSNKQLFIQNIDYALDMFLIYVLTLSIFPGFLYENTESRKGLTIAILSRFLLIPSFYFTTKYGDQGWMILLVSFLGLTNGHLTISVMTAAPKGYKGPEQNALGNILVLCLLIGIFAGVSLDWLWFIGKKNAL
ncbi:hypothetical protein GOBAR_AA18165 [Gossypium barbadense]|uniref:Equilibrative nucleotide transporter 3-like n=1 Tax=Gossypium barbadense TaxID=3634 RepID=A0A2P5XGM2_GOSBA|nr:hypothetical protein GOBAR_AA18165 [Gossypium barbadense]